MKENTKNGLIGLAVIFGGFIVWAVSGNSGPTPLTAVELTELEACKTDLKCWSGRNHTSASSLCLTAIDRIFGRDVEWNDGAELKVKPSRWLDRDAGTLVYYADKLQVPNAIGILIPVRVECNYDPAGDQLTDFRFEPRV